jgi:hypothetical protein
LTDQPSPAPTPPADWYPDPGGAWDYRYWNGHSWTAHVSRAGVAYIDPQTAHLPTGGQRVDPVVREDEPDDDERQLLAQIGAGELPVVTDPPILTRRREAVHGIFRVELLAGDDSSDDSSDDTAGAWEGQPDRGAVQDAGLLVVTSRRTIFTGRRRAEVRHDRLDDLRRDGDVLVLRAARGPARRFRFAAGSSPAVAAALVDAARLRSS